MSDAADGTLKGFKSSALLVAAVGAILLAGWVLKSAPSAAPAPASAALAPPAPTLGSSIAPELAPATPGSVEDEAPPPAAALATPAPTTAPPAPSAEATAVPATSTPVPPSSDPVLTRLATRASTDAARLARMKGRYTAQLLVACKVQTVDRLLTAGAGSTKLYVLPAQVHDDACFRVCFGSYGSAKDAAAAADLPKALRGTDRIGAVEIAKVLP